MGERETYVVVSEITGVRVTNAPGIRKRFYPTQGAAQAAASRCMRISSGPEHAKLKVMPLGQYKAPEVTVTNLMSGTPVTISAEDAGGPCDPSTERYWTM